MDFEILIKTVYQNSDEEIKDELIQDLKKQIESHQQVVLPELKRIFLMLSTTLFEAKTLELILNIHSVVNSLIRTLLVSETELNFKQMMGSLIHNLGNTEQQIRRSAKTTIENFLKKTHNLELVIEGIVQYGFNSSNSYLRAKIMGSCVRFLDLCPSIFSSKAGINDVRKMIEGMIIRLNDEVEFVRVRATQNLYKIVKLRNYEGFGNVQRRLSREHTDMMHSAVNRQILDQEDRKIKQLYEKFGEIHLDLFEDFSQDFLVEDTVGVRKYYLYQSLPQFSKTQILSFFPIGRNELYFNLIREDTLLDCFNQADSRVQQQGAKEVLEAFQSGETPYESIEDVQPHMGAFFKFLCFLLSSKNLVVCGYAMQILQDLLQHCAGVQMKAFLVLAFLPLIGKLAEEKVQIRQTAFFLLKSIIEVAKKNTLLKSLCLILNDQKTNPKNESWHIKEEVLNLISYLFLKLFEGQEEWYENAFLADMEGDGPNHVPSIDLKSVLTQVALFLDDKVMKVRKASMEALAVICSQGTHKAFLIQLLHELLDSKVYDELQDKLETGKHYFINGNGILEMPMIQIKKLQGEKDKYEERLQRYKDMLGEKDEDDISDRLVESQKEEEDQEGIEFRRKGLGQKELDAKLKSLKITYYDTQDEENRLLSMRERIKRTNANIDKYLHNHEYDGVDSVKYDIVVPIKDIPMNYSRNPTTNAPPVNNPQQVQNKSGKTIDFQAPRVDKEELFDPFEGDPFGKQVFEGIEEEGRQEKRQQEMENKEQLKKNIYLFQPLPPPKIEEVKEEIDSVDEPRMIEFEYRTDDYDPLILASKEKPKSQRLDIQKRVNQTLQKLNQGPNAPEKFVLNLPKVIQYNQRDYQAYSFGQQLTVSEQEKEGINNSSRRKQEDDLISERKIKQSQQNSGRNYNLSNRQNQEQEDDLEGEEWKDVNGLPDIEHEIEID